MSLRPLYKTCVCVPFMCYRVWEMSILFRLLHSSLPANAVLHHFSDVMGTVVAMVTKVQLIDAVLWH